MTVLETIQSLKGFEHVDICDKNTVVATYSYKMDSLTAPRLYSSVWEWPVTAIEKSANPDTVNLAVYNRGNL